MLLYQLVTIVFVDTILVLPLCGQVIDVAVFVVYEDDVYKNFSNPSSPLRISFFFINCLSLSCTSFRTEEDIEALLADMEFSYVSINCTL